MNTLASSYKKFKKHLGQNFLKDEDVLEKIVQSIPYEVQSRINQNTIKLIEIGIGLGDLTKNLMTKYPMHSLLAYEIDSHLVRLAQKRFHNEILFNKLALVNEDVLYLKHENGYLFNKDYFLVSNLPYYIATKVILQLLHDSNCNGFLVMTQKEVAKKFCAKSMSNDFCALSIICESFGKTQYLFEVKPKSFCPKPKVDSAVFLFERQNVTIDKSLEELLRFSFSSPRKQLLNNLSKWNILGRSGVEDILEKMGLKHNVRAHEIDTQQYHKMLYLIHKFYKG